MPAEEGAMTDYERQTVRETTVVDDTTVDPPVDPYARDTSVRQTVRSTESASVPARPEPVATAARVVYFVFGVLQALLILRIILLLLIANPGNDIVALILNITDPFVEPFRGMFALDRVGDREGSIFDLAALVALIGWTLVEALILAAMRIFARRPQEI
jgi:uncharacterized protein YggT (Ycf19 family)